MKNKNETTCPNCGSAIPEDAPGELCPACLLEGAATLPNPTRTAGRSAAPPSVAEIAPHFPDLEIVELLGAGGMGAVYKARQPQLDRTVAIKILSGELAGEPSFVERFNREARVLGRLSHPNIVAVFDFGTAGPYCYLLMEYVDGVNLRQAMRTGGFTPSEALALVQEICTALKFAHDEGILHRDIKPENVLIDSKGRVKIADFGIAKLIGEGEPESITLTMQGSILGSPHYMAPEQIETPGEVDQRADIYSLGVVLYEMLTGELPIGRFALPSEKAQLDARIDEIVMRTLEKERERRFQTVGEVKTEVEAIDDPSVPSQSAFITDQILGLSKMTFWIAMILLAMLFFDVAPALFGDADADDLLDATDRLFPYLVGGAILLSSISGILFAVHKIRAEGIHPDGNVTHFAPAHVPIRRDQRTAHLGLTAAILTGLSLLFAGGTLFLWNTLSNPDVRMIVAFIGLIFAGGEAIIGFILGAKALGEIRKSGGKENGLGFAIFAVVPWPTCCLAALILLSLKIPMPGGGSIGLSIAMPLTAVPLLLAVFILIRGLRRWARGVGKNDGQRHFPRLTGTVLATLGLTLLGPVLTAAVPSLFPGSGLSSRGEQEALEMEKEIERQMARAMAIRDDAASSRELNWYRGAPEIIMPVKIHDSFRAEFRLALYDSEGNVQKYAEVGSWEPFQTRTEIKINELESCLLKVGTTPPEEDGADGIGGITALIASNGQSGTLTADTDFAEWDFEIPEQRGFSLPLATAGSYDCWLAKREETIDGKNRLTVLKLEVHLIER